MTAGLHGGRTAAPQDGRCILDGAVLLAGSVDVGAERLRKRRLRLPGETAPGLAADRAGQASAPVQPDASGPTLGDASRAVERDLVAALPGEAVPAEGAERLRHLVDALPQGGGFDLVGRPDTRSAAAASGRLAPSDTPTGPETMARLLAGSRLALDRQPGLDR